MPLGTPIVVHPDGSITYIKTEGFVADAKKAGNAVWKVVVSRPVRPIEIALALAVLRGVEKTFGFNVGF